LTESSKRSVIDITILEHGLSEKPCPLFRRMP